MENHNRMIGSKVTAILLEGEFCLFVKLHWEGLAPAAGLFILLASFSSGLNQIQINSVFLINWPCLYLSSYDSFKICHFEHLRHAGAPHCSHFLESLCERESFSHLVGGAPEL